jgi:ribosomal protein S12 methylthiotransferase accessory factor
VPGYSDIYLPEELIWDNHNKALNFRESILQLHTLKPQALKSLVKELEESEIDNFTNIGELIGVAFDETTHWGQLTIGELKALSYLSLGQFEDAKNLVEMLGTFSNSLPERKKFFQALNVALDIKVGEREMADYLPNLKRMYGESLMDAVVKSVSGEIKFYGLPATDLKLTGINKHQKFIESYQKLTTLRQKLSQ